MGSKKETKRKDDSKKKPESFNPAHKNSEINSNIKKKVRNKGKKG